MRRVGRNAVARTIDFQPIGLCWWTPSAARWANAVNKNCKEQPEGSSNLVDVTTGTLAARSSIHILYRGEKCMLLRLIAVACLFVLSASGSIPVSATVVDVPADQATIQAGIDAALHGDTVLVAPGTYYENIRLKGKRILLTSNFMLAKDTAFITSTVIDGSFPVDPDTATVVMFINQEDARTILQGFTIRNGAGTAWKDEHSPGTYREGGGILCAFSAPTIRHNKIVNNIVDNTFGVTSTGGGGVRAGDGRTRLLGNRFQGNYGRYGSAIVFNHPSGGAIVGNVITGNDAGGSFGGGAIWINSASPTTRIENNTVYGNTSGQQSGGFYNFSSTLTVRNCSFWQNTPNNTGGSGTTNYTYTNITPLAAGTGNSDVAPTFVDLLNFVPADGSILIDGGDPSAVYNDVEDGGNPGFALFPAKGSLRNDMGAYGGNYLDNFDLDADGVPDVVDNCPDFPNSDQVDTDGDGRGDMCEGDDDNDDDADALDNCPLVFNPGQEDTDNEGIGDVCDNCPTVANFTQADADDDGIGDACDCACPCHGDPACDGVIDVVDVVLTVGVAFRAQSTAADPLCFNQPGGSTDTDCSGGTDVVDVVKVIGVAFRGSANDFCDPCDCNPYPTGCP